MHLEELCILFRRRHVVEALAQRRDEGTRTMAAKSTLAHVAEGPVGRAGGGAVGRAGGGAVESLDESFLMCNREDSGGEDILNGRRWARVRPHRCARGGVKGGEQGGAVR